MGVNVFGLVGETTGLASLRGAEATRQSILLLLGFTQPTVFNCVMRSGLLRAEWIFPRNDVIFRGRGICANRAT